MIKKISHILLALLLLVSTSGVSIHKHFSNGKLFSTAIFGKAKSCCEVPCGCCSEKQDVYKVHNNYTASSFTVNLQSPLDYFSFFINTLLFSYEEIAFQSIIEDKSPPSYDFDFQVKNQVFIL